METKEEAVPEEALEEAAEAYEEAAEEEQEQEEPEPAAEPPQQTQQETPTLAHMFWNQVSEPMARHFMELALSCAAGPCSGPCLVATTPKHPFPPEAPATLQPTMQQPASMYPAGRQQHQAMQHQAMQQQAMQQQAMQQQAMQQQAMQQQAMQQQAMQQLQQSPQMQPARLQHMQQVFAQGPLPQQQMMQGTVHRQPLLLQTPPVQQQWQQAPMVQSFQQQVQLQARQQAMHMQQQTMSLPRAFASKSDDPVAAVDTARGNDLTAECVGEEQGKEEMAVPSDWPAGLPLPPPPPKVPEGGMSLRAKVQRLGQVLDEQGPTEARTTTPREPSYPPPGWPGNIPAPSTPPTATPNPPSPKPPMCPPPTGPSAADAKQYLLQQLQKKRKVEEGEPNPPEGVAKRVTIVEPQPAAPKSILRPTAAPKPKTPGQAPPGPKAQGPARPVGSPGPTDM